MHKDFVKFDKEQLFEKLDKLTIEKSGSQVITKFDNRVIKTVEVSKIYEIFDIVKYMKDKIDLISENFEINSAKLVIKGGKQQLVLLSDSVEIAGSNYHKTFFIVNSSDKSRRLNLDMGLSRDDSNNYFIINTGKNLSLNRKHLKGVTKLAEDASKNISGESFDEQINAIKSLVGGKILLSKVREIIIDDDTKKINHRKFDAFKNMLIYSSTDKLGKPTSEMLKTLRTHSEDLKLDKSNDFTIDAYKVFQCYMQVFNKQDSHVIKKESDRIMKITQHVLREEKIKELLG